MSRKGKRNVIAVVFSMVAGILVILNSAALLAPGFYAMWVGAFFWLPALGPASLAFVIGVIIGLILVIGSILMLAGYGSNGSILVLTLAVISLIIGGGFLIGFILGIVGGIHSLLRRDAKILQTADATMFCRECGARILRVSKYCPECGCELGWPARRGKNTIDDKIEQQKKFDKDFADKSIRCIKCGTELPLGCKFCDNCGARQPR